MENKMKKIVKNIAKVIVFVFVMLLLLVFACAANEESAIAGKVLWIAFAALMISIILLLLSWILCTIWQMQIEWKKEENRKKYVLQLLGKWILLCVVWTVVGVVIDISKIPVLYGVAMGTTFAFGGKAGAYILSKEN